MHAEPANDPIALLRSATRDAHDALEAAPWLDEATVDMTAYGRHLSRVAAFQRDAAAAVGAHDASLSQRGLASDLPERLALLDVELDALRARDVALPHPDPAPFPALHTPSHALGCAYVLRGAALGGLVIARVVRDRLGWDSTFYRGAGAGTAAGWRAFGEAMRAAAETLDRDALVAAARATFSAYGARIVA